MKAGERAERLAIQLKYRSYVLHEEQLSILIQDVMEYLNANLSGERQKAKICYW